MANLDSRKNIRAGNLKTTNLKNIETNFNEIWTKWGTKIDASPDGSNALIVENKINSVYLPDYVLGQVMYGGTINSTGLATLTQSFKDKYGVLEDTLTITQESAAAYESVYFIVSSANNSTIAGCFDVNTGDWLISNGSEWTKIDNTDAVRTVNGQIGDVKTYKNDYAEGQQYHAGDFVLGSDGVLYVVKQDLTSSAEHPITDTSYYTPALSATLVSKLNGIQAGAQVNVLEGVQLAGSDLSISGKKVNIPLASGTTVGVVKNSVASVGTAYNLEASIREGIVYFKDTTYEVFNTGTPGLVPASGDGAADKFLCADGTFKQITIPAVPVYTLGTATDASKGQVQLKKDGAPSSTVNITGAGIAKVSSDDAGNVTVKVDVDDIPSSITLEDIQVTTESSEWTTMTIDETVYQAYTVATGKKVIKVFTPNQIQIASTSAKSGNVEADCPVVTVDSIDYVLSEEKISLIVRVISFS